MLNNKGPLMFINTVDTKIEDTPEQKVYDSRKVIKNNNLTPKIKENEVISSNEINELVDLEVDTTIKESFQVEESFGPKFIEERKIKNIIEMYQKDRPVLCNIIVNDLEIIGIPFKLDEKLLYVKTSEDECENINVDDIKDIIIIKF